MDDTLRRRRGTHYASRVPASQHLRELLWQRRTFPGALRPGACAFRSRCFIPKSPKHNRDINAHALKSHREALIVASEYLCRNTRRCQLLPSASFDGAKSTTQFLPGFLGMAERRGRGKESRPRSGGFAALDSGPASAMLCPSGECHSVPRNTP
jgi:hypothetical protein